MTPATAKSPPPIAPFLISPVISVLASSISERMRDDVWAVAWETRSPMEFSLPVEESTSLSGMELTFAENAEDPSVYSPSLVLTCFTCLRSLLTSFYVSSVCRHPKSWERSPAHSATIGDGTADLVQFAYR